MQLIYLKMFNYRRALNEPRISSGSLTSISDKSGETGICLVVTLQISRDEVFVGTTTSQTTFDKRESQKLVNAVMR